MGRWVENLPIYKIEETWMKELLIYLGSGKGLLYFSIFLGALFCAIFLLLYTSKYRRYMGQALIPVVFIEIAILFLVISVSYVKKGEVGPAIVPRLWAYGLIGLNIYLLIRALTGKDGEDPKYGHIEKVALFLVLVVIYVFSMIYLGYYISTLGFIVLAIYLLNYKKFFVISLVGTGWLVLAYIAFYKLSYVPLPIGKVFKGLF